ncbi:MAG TPA: hypothetical protein VJ180_03855 [Pyrinomonadaceae bacterium]|nr:hypothetical protein [Pyrinomonadaceae bacterium]
MMTIFYFVAAALFGVLIYFGIRYFVRSRERFGGGRVIICPETGKQAMVEVDARHAAFTSLFGQPSIQLESCWRWPLNKECGQECLIQLNVAPPECLVRGVLMKWYKGKRCPFCQKVFEAPRLIDHKPALVNPEGITLEWSEISLPRLMEVLKTHQPVCWNCHTAQKFQREHPDLVVERPWKSVAM